MAEGPPQSVEVQALLRRLGEGDPAALNELLSHVSDRLQRLTRQMLKSHPAVKRWAQTDDVLQGSLVRLLRAVQNVKPESARAFFALATQQIRWELIDLARHFYGPEGPGANHATQHADDNAAIVDPPDSAGEPSNLAEWCEFHHKIDQLADNEREVVGLLFYQGLTQVEAAEILQVTVRTVQRRWHSALVKLHDSLQGHWPET